MNNLPYQAKKAFIPLESLLTLGVFLPPTWKQIKNQAAYLGLLADRVQWMAQQEDFPGAVREALRHLDDQDLLIAVEPVPETGQIPPDLGQQIIHRMQMEDWLVEHHDLNQIRFPVKLENNPDLMPAEELAKVRLGEWTSLISEIPRL